MNVLSENEQNAMLYRDELTNTIKASLKKTSKKAHKEQIVHIPTFDEPDFLKTNNYNITNIKIIAKHYKLKTIGNKGQIIARICDFLVLSKAVLKIQTKFRGYLCRKYVKLRGPALKNKKLCTNVVDFLSMENTIDIPNVQFYSYIDDDGFVYGFDLMSFHNLVYKSDDIIKNPFNTKIIKSNIIDDFKTLLRLSKMLNVNINTVIPDIANEVSNTKAIELRALSLFQYIDALGNYSNSQWFLSLNRSKLIRFTRELHDIWNYRAPLTKQVKRAISPPFGNPFSNLSNYLMLYNLENVDDIRNIVLDILEKMVTIGTDKDNKCLGAYYVLGALTITNNDAASALPWLYQAVCHM